MTQTEILVLHATCVVAHGNGVLIRGASGRGKSGLALQLMALGARLVADDKVTVRQGETGLIASAPPSIRGLIEARGIGLLNAETVAEATIDLVVDLDQTEPDRLPEMHLTEVLGQSLPLLYRVASDHFASGLMQYLLAGRMTEK